MILIDDILLSPVRSLFWIFEEIYHSAQETIATDAESITAELSALYMRLETGKISEEEFAAGEKILLDRLDQVEKSEEETE